MRKGAAETGGGSGRTHLAFSGSRPPGPCSRSRHRDERGKGQRRRSRCSAEAFASAPGTRSRKSQRSPLKALARDPYLAMPGSPPPEPCQSNKLRPEAPWHSSGTRPRTLEVVQF